jgi:hypothetical protein
MARSGPSSARSSLPSSTGRVGSVGRRWPNSAKFSHLFAARLEKGCWAGAWWACVLSPRSAQLGEPVR